jgi:hypothetical protein
VATPAHLEDKKLERKISKIEKKDKSVKNEDLTPMFFGRGPRRGGLLGLLSS